MADALHEHGIWPSELFNYGGSNSQPYNQTWGYTRRWEMESRGGWQPDEEKLKENRIPS
jgi:hypothetical protein